jgi:hypothetical protein
MISRQTVGTSISNQAHFFLTFERSLQIIKPFDVVLLNLVNPAASLFVVEVVNFTSVLV